MKINGMMLWLNESFVLVARWVLFMARIAWMYLVYNAIRWIPPKLKRFFLVRIDAHRISRRQLESSLPQDVVHRPGISESLRRALGNPESETVVVYGARGAGKTTAIDSFFQNQKGVIAWKVTADSQLAAIEELKEKWDALYTLKDQEDVIYAEDVCLRILSKSGHPLVIVIFLKADAQCAVRTGVNIFCKTTLLRKDCIRFMVDVPSSRVTLNLEVDFMWLRVSAVRVGPLTQSEAQSFLGKQLPSQWTDVQKHTVSQEITSNFGFIVSTLKEICDKFNDGMRMDEALKIVYNIRRTNKTQALSRLKELDAQVANELQELPFTPLPPSLKKENGLDQDGLDNLKQYLTGPGFTRLIDDLGPPYIFEIDPATEEVELSTPVMKEAFLEHYE